MGSHTSPNVHPRHISHNFVWDAGALAWIAETQPESGGGGGVQYVEGDTTTPATGTVALARHADGSLRPVPMSESGNLLTELSGALSPGSNLIGSITIKDAGGVEADVTAANALKVDGSAVTQPVSGTFFQATQPISATNLDVALSTRTKPADQQHTIVDSGSLTANAGTNLNTSALLTTAAHDAAFGTAGTADAQVRSVQGIASMTPLQVQSNAATLLSETDFDTKTGSLTESAPASDTASSGLNGRLQRIAQRLTSLIGLLPTALVGGRLDVNGGAWAGTAVDVNSGTKSAGTLRVTLATDQVALTNKLLVTPDSVALPANQSTNVNQFGGTNVVTGTGASAAGVPRVTVANDSNVIVTPPTLTKATQGATGFSVQELHDAGRVEIRFYAVGVAAGTTTTETAITLTKSSGTSATSTGTSFVVTSGKRFRITGVSVATRGNAVATVQSTTFNLRVNTAGAVGTTSTPIVLAIRSATPAVISAWDRFYCSFEEGWEILGDGTLQIGMTAAATYLTNAPTWDALIVGYEY